MLSLILLLCIVGDVTKPKPSLVRPQPVTVEGFYRLSGVDSDSKKYYGSCHITKLKDSSTWAVYYAVGHGLGRGMVQYQGVGILDGNRFAVAWSMTLVSGETLRGVTLYTVGEGSWQGVWATMPLSCGTETLKRIPD